MARIQCTETEYDRLSTVLSDNPQYLADVPIIWEIVEVLDNIPKNFKYDTETDDFYVYREIGTGYEIHIPKNPKIFLVKETS